MRIIENGLNEIQDCIINIQEQNERQHSLLKKIISKNEEQANNVGTMFKELYNSIIASNNENKNDRLNGLSVLQMTISNGQLSMDTKLDYVQSYLIEWSSSNSNLEEVNQYLMNVMNDYANSQERYTCMLINEEVKTLESLQMEFDGKWDEILVKLGGVMKTKMDYINEEYGKYC
jgi:hypothetical protein